LSRDRGIITVLDRHPAAGLARRGLRPSHGSARNRAFGQTGTIRDLYRHYGSMRTRSSTRRKARQRARRYGIARRRV